MAAGKQSDSEANIFLLFFFKLPLPHSTDGRFCDSISKALNLDFVGTELSLSMHIPLVHALFN